MRDAIAQRVITLLRDLDDNELTLLPSALQSEIDQRLERAASDVRSAERELDRKQALQAGVRKRFEVFAVKP